jgi:hypothetical protein
VKIVGFEFDVCVEHEIIEPRMCEMLKKE